MNENKIEQILQQIENDPENVSLYVQYKNLCIQSKLYGEAEEAFQYISDTVNEKLQEALQTTGQIPDLGFGETVFQYLSKNYYEWGMHIYKYQPERTSDVIALFKSSIDSDKEFDKVYEPLAEIYFSLSQFENWLDASEKAITFQKNKKLKIDTLLKMKEIAENSGEYKRVAKYYQILMEDDKPKYKEYFDKLESLLESLEEWSQLARLYEERLKEKLDPKTKELYTNRLIDIYTNKAPNKDKIFLSLCENYKKNFKDIKIKEQLEVIVEENRMHEELLSFYETIVESVPDKNIKTSILTKIGDILHTNLQEFDEAYQNYEKVLVLSPGEPYILAKQAEILKTKEKSAEVDAKLVEIFNQLGNHYLLRVKNEDEALNYFYDTIKIDPKNETAFQNLIKIFNTKKMFSEKSDLLKIKLDNCENSEKGKLAFMLGEILYKSLNRKTESIKYFQIAYNNGEKNSLPFIESIAKEEENYEVLLQYKISSVETLKLPKEKADTLREIGEVYQNKVMDVTKAVYYFVQSLKYDYKNTELAIKVLEYSYENGEYETIKDILSEIDKSITLKKDFALYFKLGKVAHKLNQKDLASLFYKKASDLNKKDYDVFWEMGILFEEMEDFAKGYRNFQYIEATFKSLDDIQKHQLFAHLGRNAYMINDKKARKYLEDTISLSKSDIDSLTLYYKLLETEKEFEKSIQIRLEVANLINDKSNLVKLYTEIAEIYKKELNNIEKYLIFYNEIFKLAQNDKDLLMFLLDSYTKNHHYQQAVNVLNRLTEIENDENKKIDYKFGLLSLYEKNLKDGKNTLRLYKELYSLLPKDAEVVTGYEECLKKFQLWSQLVTFYVDRIKLTDIKEHKALWLTIADLYANQLKDLKQATIAIEQALKLDPKNIHIKGALIDLYYRIGENPEKQIEFLRRNIKDDPFNDIYYQYLFNIYLQQKKIDNAYVIARILRYFSKNNEDQKKVLAAFKGKGKLEWGIVLTKYHWDLIIHHRLKNQITDIFNAISSPMIQLYARPFKINLKEQLDFNKQKNLFTSVYQMVSTFLNMPSPKLFVKQGVSGIEFVNVGEILLNVGYDIYNNNDDKTLLYAIGKSLTYLRPEFILPKIVTGSVVTNIFLGVLNYVIPNMNIAGDVEQLMAITKHFEKQTAPETLESIRDVVEAFVRAKGSIDLNKWLNAVEFTGDRIAFMLTQDLEFLDSMFKRETIGVLSKADFKMKMGDILNFSISDEYFTLRKELGLKVQ